MDDLSAAQMLLGTGGAVIIVGLVQYLKPIWTGLVLPEWESRSIPILTLLLSAVWQVVIVNVLSSMGTAVTFNGWILAFLTVVCALSAAGFYGNVKTAVRG